MSEKPFLIVNAGRNAHKLFHWDHMLQRYGLILAGQKVRLRISLDKSSCSRTMTFPRANGFPHSLVSNDCRSSSPIRRDRNSGPSGPGGIRPSLAAFVKTSSHTATLAAYPSGLL